MGKPSPPPAPDYTPLLAASQTTAASDAAAAQIQAQVAREQLAQQNVYAGRAADVADKQFAMEQEAADFGRSQYNDILPYLHNYLTSQQSFQDASGANLTEQLAAAEDARQRATETYDTYKNVYVPRMTQFTNEAFDYGSTARQDAAAAAARGDVATAFTANQDAATRTLASYGIDPTQGRYTGAMQGMAIGKSAAEAAAGTLARQQTQQQGKQYELAAIQAGQGLPAQAIGQAGLGQTGGSAGLAGAAVGGAGIGAGYQGLVAGTNAMGSPTGYAAYTNPYTTLSGAYGTSATGFNTGSNIALGNAGQVIGTAGNIMNAGFSNQMSAYQQQAANQASLFGGIGKAIGGIAGFFA